MTYREQIRFEKLYKHHILNIVGLYANKDEFLISHYYNYCLNKLFTLLPRYDPQQPFVNWMRVIVKRTAIDCHRETQCLKNLPNSTSINDHLEYEKIIYEGDILASKENEEEALNAVRCLEGTTKRVFILKAFQDYSHPDIAQELNIGESASKWHFQKARRILQGHFKI